MRETQFHVNEQKIKLVAMQLDQLRKRIKEDLYGQKIFKVSK